MRDSAASRPLVLRLLPALDFGGAESRLILQSELATGRFYDLRVCALGRDGRAADSIRGLGVQVDVLGLAPSVRAPQTTLALARYLRVVRPTILHTSVAEANFHGLLAGIVARVPVRIAEEVGTPSHGRLSRRAWSLLYATSTRVVAVTQAIADYLVEIDGAPRARVRTVYSCAGPRFFPEARPPVHRARGSRTRFVAVGRFEAVKNHIALVEAFALLQARHPETELWLVGAGPLEPLLRQRVADLGLGDTVIFHGYRADIEHVLAACDVYVLPSLSEGCSISLIEAMASGMRVIGSDVDGIREVLGPELSSASLFPPTDPAAMADTMSRAFKETTRMRAERAALGQTRAYSQFSPQAYLARLDELYRDALVPLRPS